MVERRAPIILYNLVRKETTSSSATLQIRIFFLAILWTLCEVPADHSRHVCRRFPDDCTLLHMNLQITYMEVSQKMFRLLVTCSVFSGRGGGGVGDKGCLDTQDTTSGLGPAVRHQFSTACN